MDRRLDADIEWNRVMAAAMQCNQIPLIRKLVLRNIGDQPLASLSVTITLNPELAAPLNWELESVLPGEGVELPVSQIKVDESSIVACAERQEGEILLEVAAEEEQLLRKSFPFTFLPANGWLGGAHYPELTAAYITPRHPAVVELVERAKGLLPHEDGELPVTGYGSQNPLSVCEQMKAIYVMIADQGIEKLPLDRNASYPVVQFADSVAEKRQGTDLDLTLLYCSCLEAAGLHPLFLFEEDGVSAGCWLEGQSFPESLQDDLSVLSKRLDDGQGTIFVIDAASAVDGIPFEEAVHNASARILGGSFQLLLDVARARAGGVIPLQLGWEDVSAPAAKEAQVPSLLAPQGAEEKTSEFSRQQVWERNLLDLSLRNMLVNFRVTKSTLQIVAADCSQLEDALAVGTEFQVLGRPSDWDADKVAGKIFYPENITPELELLISSEMQSGRLRAFLPEQEAAASMKTLYRQAKIGLEENGSNTLFLAIGFLKWYESEVSEKPRYAPLVLFPIEIVRKSAQHHYAIRMRDEEPQMNITLLEMLRQDFGIVISGLDPLPRDQSGVNLAAVFHAVRQAVLDHPRWDVTKLSFLGLFSFSQFIMWSDIRNRCEDLKRSKIVRSLMSGRMEWEPSVDFPCPRELDEKYLPQDMAVPITADASQLAAICAAGSGKSFVLHGPPGTGKSQTITNIIANALYHGKTVLFLAEKMAALSVVQKRLEKIGLGPFALELHSNKAKKKDVLSQLEQALEIGHIRPTESYTEQAERLYQLRCELNTYVDALHRPQPYGFSAWEAITRYEACQDAPADVCFGAEDIRGLNPHKLQIWEDIAGELQTAAYACGTPAGHPLREWTISGYSSSVRSELGARLGVLGQHLNRLQKLLAEFCGGLGLEADGNRKYLESLMGLVSRLRMDSAVPACLLTSGELAPLRDDLDELCAGGRKRDAARDALLVTYRREILLFNEPTARAEWEKAAASWLIPRLIGQNRIFTMLRELAKEPKSFVRQHVEATLNLVAEYDQGTRIIADKERLFITRFGPLWNGREPDWRKLEQVFEQACGIQETVFCLTDDPEKRRDVLMKIAQMYLSTRTGEEDHIGRQLKDLLDSFSETFEEVVQIWRLGRIRMDTSSEHYLAYLCECQKRWGDNLPLLRDWCNWMAVQQRAVGEGLGVLVGVCRSGAVEPEQLMEAYHRGLYAACADFVIEQEPLLSSFHGAMFEKKIQAFRRTSKDFEQLTRSELVAKLSAKIPSHSSGIASASEIGILQKAIRSGGRALSIRRLFDSIPNLLRLLCPCMLMSPISVAQYIDPQYPPFDLVIFDEASQLPTCEAVGAIARGENVIIVGDPKQLPPTSFFVGTHNDEDALDQQDLESILDDCLAISMPEEHLRWHYRSRHESLIAFSNRQYYENRLYTFPSPNDLESKVTLIPVEGSYDRGKSKQNRAEAEAVVAEILRRLSDPVLCRDSIGVVTFSAVQQNLIEDLLLEAFCVHPELEEQNAAADEPVFIKNLENVQGDERDVILFSIGYGPDEHGKVALNFGPLNREGGWRRLNVAVSRARKEMKVYSTLRPEQIDLTKTRSEGVAGLKAFLEFAEKGYGALSTPAQEATAERYPFADYLASHIRRLGYEVRTNVGCSGFRIDLAIVDPRYPNEYLLGILCDGEYYREGETARDRNMNQEAVLRSLGWHLHHIWVLEWREDPIRELERVKEAIDQALHQEHHAPIPVPPEEKRQFHFDQSKLEREPEPEEKLIGYEICRLPEKIVGAEEFCLPEHDAEILSQLKKVVEMEAPVSGNILCRRVMNAWGISRMSARIERRFAPLLEQLPGSQTHCEDKTFYWSRKRGPRKYADFRVPGDNDFRRDPEDIPPEELANAIRYVLQRQIGLPREDLIREVYKLFGFQRAGSAIAGAAEAGIQMALRRGYAVADEGRFVLPQA